MSWGGEASAGVRSRAGAGRSMPRDLAVDRMRGTLVLLMVVGDYIGGLGITPVWLRHAPDIGLTVADLVAPAFVFVIGVNYGPSFRRRLATDARRAYAHAAIRALALIGIGAILSAGGTVVAGRPSDWGVLQALGMAVLIGLPFIGLPTWVRFAAGAALLLCYQWALDAWWLQSVLGSAQGGFLGSISWGALLILSTAVADVFRRGGRRYAVCCTVLIAAAVAAALVVPVSKNRVSLSFVLIALATAAVAFFLFEAAARVLVGREGFFCWWGQNALVLYLAHLLLLGLVQLPDAPAWYVRAPVWLASAQLTALVGILSAIAWGLHRRGLRLRL